jgi:hypothetical protein
LLGSSRCVLKAGSSRQAHLAEKSDDWGTNVIFEVEIKASTIISLDPIHQEDSGTYLQEALNILNKPNSSVKL